MANLFHATFATHDRCTSICERHPLLIILLISVVDNVEEAELVDTLAGRNHAKPVTKLLLLEVLLCPVHTILGSTLSDVGDSTTYRYLR
jgi:hypothetical protein